MSTPFLAEIRIFAGNFAPNGWAKCDGQLLLISQSTALFSLLGTTYGGDGKTTFALPDLRGAAPLQQGEGSGLSWRVLGETGGDRTVTLMQSEMPAHSHGVRASSGRADQLSPSGNVWATARTGRRVANQYAAAANTVTMSFFALSIEGGSMPHNNMPPYLTLNFIIAMQGIYPSRS